MKSTLRARCRAFCAGAALLCLLACLPVLADHFFQLSGSNTETNGGATLSADDTLTVTSSGEVHVSESRRGFEARALESAANNTTLANKGAVSATAEASGFWATASAYGQGLDGDHGTISNSGEINVRATATAAEGTAEADAWGIYASDSYSDAVIVNSGSTCIMRHGTQLIRLASRPGE